MDSERVRSLVQDVVDSAEEAGEREPDESVSVSKDALDNLASEVEDRFVEEPIVLVHGKGPLTTGQVKGQVGLCGALRVRIILDLDQVNDHLSSRLSEMILGGPGLDRIMYSLVEARRGEKVVVEVFGNVNDEWLEEHKEG